MDVLTAVEQPTTYSRPQHAHIMKFPFKSLRAATLKYTVGVFLFSYAFQIYVRDRHGRGKGTERESV